MNTPALPQTAAERDALFAKLLAGVLPADKRPESMLDRLKPFRPQLLAKRKEGYSLRQLADAVRQPPLSLQVSPSTIRAVIGGAAAKRRARNAKLAAKAAALAAARAASGQTGAVGVGGTR